jgi:RNA polymerase sigma-70 factor, ECF subfamily
MPALVMAEIDAVAPAEGRASPTLRVFPRGAVGVVVPSGEGVRGDVVELEVALLNACRAGDPGAFRDFVRRYEKVVFAFLSRALGRGAHVEDLAQEVFLRAYRALPTYDVRGPARVSTWLLTIARRLACDARRKRRIQLPLREHEPLAQAPTTPESEGQRLELARALAKAAAALPEDQLDAFILVEFHGFGMAELADVLGIPESTAKTRLFRARERLRELLGPLWEDRS